MTFLYKLSMLIGWACFIVLMWWDWSRDMKSIAGFLARLGMSAILTAGLIVILWNVPNHL